MLKLDIKDKQLLKYLDAYCMIMDITINDYIINAIESHLNEDLRNIQNIKYTNGNYVYTKDN